MDRLTAMGEADRSSLREAGNTEGSLLFPSVPGLATSFLLGRQPFSPHAHLKG